MFKTNLNVTNIIAKTKHCNKKNKVNEIHVPEYKHVGHALCLINNYYN